MNRISRLIEAYGRYISIPWQPELAPIQRVIYCVYNAVDELRLRATIGEFELATKDGSHGWFIFDLTNSFATWLAQQKYANSYFVRPSLLSTLMHRYQEKIVADFTTFLAHANPGDSDVVAVTGVGSLFGLLKVSGVVEDLAPLVAGRLVVFFPGAIPEKDNYRLFDAYDGWNYLAVAITADSDL